MFMAAATGEFSSTEAGDTDSPLNVLATFLGSAVWCRGDGGQRRRALHAQLWGRLHRKVSGRPGKSRKMDSRSRTQASKLASNLYWRKVGRRAGAAEG